MARGKWILLIFNSKPGYPHQALLKTVVIIDEHVKAGATVKFLFGSDGYEHLIEI